jgi:hypothetical protein
VRRAHAPRRDRDRSDGVGSQLLRRNRPIRDLGSEHGVAHCGDALIGGKELECLPTFGAVFLVLVLLLVSLSMALRRWTSALLKTVTGTGVMLGKAVSPSVTENSPLLTKTGTELEGSWPRRPVPSLLQKVAVPSLLTNENLNAPSPLKMILLGRQLSLEMEELGHLRTQRYAEAKPDTGVQKGS